MQQKKGDGTEAWDSVISMSSMTDDVVEKANNDKERQAEESAKLNEESKKI